MILLWRVNVFPVEGPFLYTLAIYVKIISYKCDNKILLYILDF